MALPSQPVSDADNACAIASGASTVCHRRPGAVALGSVPRPHASSGGLPGRPTWVAGAAAVPLAVAVLLAVGVLLRVLQAQLVAHLEGLPHRADDPHRLALRGERLRSAALAPGRGGGEASSRNSAHVGSLASRRAGLQSRKRSGPLGPPASLHSARQPSPARPEQPGPLSRLGAVGPARRPWQVSPASGDTSAPGARGWGPRSSEPRTPTSGLPSTKM